MNWNEIRALFLVFGSLVLVLVTLRGNRDKLKTAGTFGMSRQAASTLAIMWLLLVANPKPESFVPALLWIWVAADLFELTMLGFRMRKLGRLILRVPLTAYAKFLTIFGYGVLIPGGLLIWALRPEFPRSPLLGIALIVAIRMAIELRGMSVCEYGVRVYRFGFLWSHIREFRWELKRGILVIEALPKIWQSDEVEIRIAPGFWKEAMETMNRLSETTEKIWIFPSSHEGRTVEPPNPGEA